jgi:hypothetical protein
MEHDFVENFKIKDGLGCSASVEKAGVGFKMIAFNNTPIPMTVDGFERKNLSVVFTVLNTTQEGFSRVPYENVNGKTKASLTPISSANVQPHTHIYSIHSLHR